MNNGSRTLGGPGSLSTSARRRAAATAGRSPSRRRCPPGANRMLTLLTHHDHKEMFIDAAGARGIGRIRYHREPATRLSSEFYAWYLWSPTVPATSWVPATSAEMKGAFRRVHYGPGAALSQSFLARAAMHLDSTVDASTLFTEWNPGKARSEPPFVAARS